MPFRNRRRGPIASRKALALVLVPCALLLGSVGTYGVATNGAQQRFADAKPFLDYFADPISASPYFRLMNVQEAYGDECNFYTDAGRSGAAKERIEPSCFTRDGRPNAIFIWGDSHAQMYRAGLLRTLPSDWQVMQVASSGCGPRLEATSSDPPWCAISNLAALENIRKIKPEVVLLGQVHHWSVRGPRSVIVLAQKLLDMGVGRVIITGPSPRRFRELPTFIALNWPDVPKRTWEGVDKSYVQYDQDLSEHFKSASNQRIFYASPLRVLCSREGCLTYAGSNKALGIMSIDQNHLSPVASEIVARSVLRGMITRDLKDAVK